MASRMRIMMTPSSPVAGTSPSLFGDEIYMYGGFYYKDNTVTVIDTYENDITCKTQVNSLLDKLGLPRP